MEKTIIFHPPQSNPVAEVVSGEILISTAQEALDLMMEIGYQGSDSNQARRITFVPTVSEALMQLGDP